MALIEKKKKTDRYSKEYLTKIKLRDFLGHLTPDEVEIAKEQGLYKWDCIIKKRNAKTI